MGFQQYALKHNLLQSYVIYYELCDTKNLLEISDKTLVTIQATLPYHVIRTCSLLL